MKMKIKSVENFRPLMTSDTDESTCRIYRSGKHDRISQEDSDRLKQMKIRSVIDLRSIREHAREKEDKMQDREKSLIEIHTNSRELKGRLVEKGKFIPVRELERSYSVTDVKHYFVPVINRHFIWGLIQKFPWFYKLYLGLLFVVDKILGTSKSAQVLVNNTINKEGLDRHYMDFLEFSSGAMLSALKLLTIPSNIPCVICCAIGKDRTGVLSALIQGCLGVSKEAIVDGYHQSEKELRPKDSRMMIPTIYGKLTLSKEFDYAKKETMINLLDYIDQKYGSVSGYLDYIGFGPEDQTALRRNLLK